jgi:hypothetical protein
MVARSSPKVVRMEMADLVVRRSVFWINKHVEVYVLQMEFMIRVVFSVIVNEHCLSGVDVLCNLVCSCNVHT